MYRVWGFVGWGFCEFAGLGLWYGIWLRMITTNLWFGNLKLTRHSLLWFMFKFNVFFHFEWFAFISKDYILSHFSAATIGRNGTKMFLFLSNAFFYQFSVIGAQNIKQRRVYWSYLASTYSHDRKSQHFNSRTYQNYQN